jgi:hypothetical protein
MKTLLIQVTSSRAQQHARGRIINNRRCLLLRHRGYQDRPCHPEKKGHASLVCLAQTIAILGTSSIRGAFVESAKRLLVNPRWLWCRPVVLSLSFLLFRPAALYAQDFWQGPIGATGNWFSASNWTAGVGVPTNAVNAFVNNGGTAQIAENAAKAFRSGAKTADSARR